MKRKTKASACIWCNKPGLLSPLPANLKQKLRPADPPPGELTRIGFGKTGLCAECNARNSRQAKPLQPAQLKAAVNEKKIAVAAGQIYFPLAGAELPKPIRQKPATCRMPTADPPPARPARTVKQAAEGREEGMRRAQDHAEEKQSGFTSRAIEFVPRFLADHGPAAGEDIVDAARKAGIKPHADQAFGIVFAILCRREVIEKNGSAPRRKGHLAPGATIWKLGEPTMEGRGGADHEAPPRLPRGNPLIYG